MSFIDGVVCGYHISVSDSFANSVSIQFANLHAMSRIFVILFRFSFPIFKSVSRIYRSNFIILPIIVLNWINCTADKCTVSIVSFWLFSSMCWDCTLYERHNFFLFTWILRNPRDYLRAVCLLQCDASFAKIAHWIPNLSIIWLDFSLK